jgi:ATP-dependent exoDNAse (exonuclease V) alpha subunit
MTRAKDRLVLISDGFGVKQAARNNKIEERYSLLAERIQGQENHTRDSDSNEKAEI